MKDGRSIAYDTLRLAKKDVQEAYSEWQEKNSDRLLQEDQPQQDVGDITYWIYTSKTPDGVFDEESIPSMREAEATILENEQYDDYCRLVYDDITGERLYCQKPLSAMNIYYASQWDSATAQSIMTQLGTSETRDLYNILAPCVEFGFACDLIPDAVTDVQKQWAAQLNVDITSMIATWDGDGELNADVSEVTLFIAHMNELMTKAPYVNFFFDANFGLDNLKSMYSRSIVYYGELLPGTKDVDESEDKLKRCVLVMGYMYIPTSYSIDFICRSLFKTILP